MCIMEPQELNGRHIPVLLQEVLEGLQCEQQGGVYLDCTVGCGGHTAAILARHPENRVIGIDQDASVLQIARQRLMQFGDRVRLFHQRFEQVEQVLLPDERVDGIILDLGVSSLQLDEAARGFSFQKTGKLDMRMNQTEDDKIGGSLTAYHVVNTYPRERLVEIFSRYGEERFSKRIANRIVETRSSQPIETTTQLAEIAARAVPKRFHTRGIHPATRIFQAIRIEVNGELQALGQTLERLMLFLRERGRCCVISFHSLEDRIVKRTFTKLAKGCQCPPDFPVCMCGLTPSVTILTKKPILPSEEEQQRNPRSRSAKLRIAEKIA